MKKNIKAVCFGEVLFDNFPSQSKIGGAPLNVSGRLQAFGVDVSLISSVGDDSQGKKIKGYLKKIGLDLSGIQVNKNYPTGK